MKKLIQFIKWLTWPTIYKVLLCFPMNGFAQVEDQSQVFLRVWPDSNQADSTLLDTISIVRSPDDTLTVLDGAWRNQPTVKPKKTRYDDLDELKKKKKNKRIPEK